MNLARTFARSASLVVIAGGITSGQSTILLSADPMGAPADQHSGYSSISADGRYVAFWSSATNLVAGDTNFRDDIFVRDLQANVTTRVSVDSAGVEANDGSLSTSISADGRYVAFSSLATNLVPGDTNGQFDVFVHDLQSGTTTRVSLSSGGGQGNGYSYAPALSGDGRYVSFGSVATNLAPGDSNAVLDAFVHDRQTGTTTRASVSSAGIQGSSASYCQGISADGRYVVFLSESANLVTGDAGVDFDVFVRDRQTAVTSRVSIDSVGQEGNAHCGAAAISADGRFVAFSSLASNLVFGDTNGEYDVFVHDRQNGATTRVSVDSAGGQANESSYFSSPSISADGRFVAFDSFASNLVPGDTNGTLDVFLRDRFTGSTIRASVGTANAEGDNGSTIPSISADGRLIAFESGASTLVAGDTNFQIDVFVRDRGMSPVVSHCFGDGSSGPCPCGNAGQAGRGCENSSGTGGAQLAYFGTPSLSADSFVLSASDEKPTALSIFLQGNAFIAPVVYGDGLRCVGGALKRLYTKNAVGGVVTAPQGVEPSISVRSAAAGDPIPLGATRHYQTYYRDPVTSFCPAPAGNTWNIGTSLSAVWEP